MQLLPSLNAASNLRNCHIGARFTPREHNERSERLGLRTLYLLTLLVHVKKTPCHKLTMTSYRSTPCFKRKMEALEKLSCSFVRIHDVAAPAAICSSWQGRTLELLAHYHAWHQQVSANFLSTSQIFTLPGNSARQFFLHSNTLHKKKRGSFNEG
jgi:hypothetical protein